MSDSLPEYRKTVLLLCEIPPTADQSNTGVIAPR